MIKVLVTRTVKTVAGNVLAAKGETLVCVEVRGGGAPGREFAVCETPNHYAGCKLSSLPFTHLKLVLA